ncbi:predicted protein, partial [Nematostella vectensis]
MPTTAPEIEEPGRLKTKLVEILTQKDGKGLQMLDDDFGGVRGIIHRLQTSSKKGILDTSDALARRTKSFGSNRISGQAKRRGFFRALLYSMTDIVLILLVLGGIASVILGYYYREVCKGKYIPDSEKNAWMEGAGILGTAAVIVLLSTLSDYLREKSFYRLQKRIESERKTRVMRGGEMKEICYQDVKVGDLCVIGPGSIIPADGILVENTELTTDESSLNKESRASKTSRDPFVFASTHVTEGSGKMIILAVGDSTQIAAITRQQPKQKVDDEFDPDDFRQTLHGKLTMASAILGLIGIIIGIIVGLVLLISFLVKTYEIDNIPYDASHWNEIIKTFIIAVVIIIVAEPEGLSMAVTITLSRSLRNMCAQDIFVRNADVLETMGSVTTLCCNKTGVLTAVSKIPLYEEVAECFVGGKHFRGDTSHYKSDIAVKVVHEVAKGIAINTSYNSNIQVRTQLVSSSERNQVGDITECALLQFTADLGVYYPFIREANPCEEFSKVFPFSPETRSMTTVVKENATYKVYCKGSPEVVLPRCVRLLNMDEQEETLDADRLKKVNDIITAMQEKSQLKVMCLAYGTTPFKGRSRDVCMEPRLSKEPNWDEENRILSDMHFVGFVGMEESVRGEVSEAILRCRRAGLMITMVTGASLQTAGSFAQNCGILTPNKYWPAVEKTIIGYDSKLLNEEISDDSGKISQVEFDKLWPDVRVVSRCTPEGKRSFMQAIRRSRVRREGEVVAVVASGVHDANFLRDADVGLSMGATGTDIAQEASDIVLKGDKFSSVLDTIKWGRHIYETVLKFLQFQLTATWVTMIVLIIGAILFQKSIFSAAQLLWLNLIMDALASLALTGDHPTDDILRHKPYGRNKPLISRAVLRNVIGHAIYQIAVVFIVIYLIADFTDTRFGYSAESLCRPTQHSTMVFTTFILMQLFNEVNCRRVSSRNVFSGPFDWVFLIVLLLCIGVQIIIVQFFTNSFRVEPLDWQQWLWCFFFGFSELIWGQIIFSVPKGVIPRFFR